MKHVKQITRKPLAAQIPTCVCEKKPELGTLLEDTFGLECKPEAIELEL